MRETSPILDAVLKLQRMRNRIMQILQKREYALPNASSSASLQNTRSRGVAGSTSRGWRLVGLGEEMVRFRGGFRDQGVETGRFRSM